MSYVEYVDPYYRRLVLSGQYPNPYCYPYFTPFFFPNISSAPNLSNQDCDNISIRSLWDNYYCYDRINIYDIASNLCYNAPEPCNAKYDYYYYDRIPYQDPSVVMGFTVQYLVSNVLNLAINPDPNLLDPWGIIIVNDIVWVANAGSGLITRYDLLGRRLLPVVNVFGPNNNIAQPTGIDSNDDLSAFIMVNGPITGPSLILTATRDGTINGYNFDIDHDNSILLIDNSKKNSVYTGLAVACSVLYVADFYNQKIDVYDKNLKKISDCDFVDECYKDPIPKDYAPYNIINIGDLLYVTYAKQSPLDNQYPLCGRGFGYVNIFNLRGKFVRRFASCGTLNVPWGLSCAPSWFSYPPGSIMVANFGDGKINIFDHDGKCLGNLHDEFYNEICLEGLRGITVNPNYDRILYWTENANNLRESFMGTINTRILV